MSMSEIRGARPDTDYSRVDLNNVWAEQALTLVERGFHVELGMSEEVYQAGLPKFGLKPENAEGRFDVPILVDPRLSLKRLAEFSGINYGIGHDEALSDWPGNDFTAPTHPYTVWAGIKDLEPREEKDVLQNEKWKALGPDENWTAEQWREFMDDIRRAGREYRLRGTIPSIREKLKADERGSTVLEGLFYYLYNPEIFMPRSEAIAPDRMGPEEPFILMVGSQVYEYGDRYEGRLFLGRYINADLWLTTNGDPAATHPDPRSRPLVVAR